MCLTHFKHIKRLPNSIITRATPVKHLVILRFCQQTIHFYFFMGRSSVGMFCTWDLRLNKHNITMKQNFARALTLATWSNATTADLPMHRNLSIKYISFSQVSVGLDEHKVDEIRFRYTIFVIFYHIVAFLSSDDLLPPEVIIIYITIDSRVSIPKWLPVVD